ncbi:MAG: hypothetical protein HYY84_05990 [Deltaproteobacteria bacterium]|nr:hypothetical protein [Deltaproteobacteria bacterium]
MLSRQSSDLSMSSVPDLDVDESPFSALPTPPGPTPLPAPVRQAAAELEPSLHTVGGIDLDFEFNSGTEASSPLPTPTEHATSTGAEHGVNPDLSFFDDPEPPAPAPGPQSGVPFDAPLAPRPGPPPTFPEVQLAPESPAVGAPKPFIGAPQAAKPRRIEIPQVGESPSVFRVLLRGFFVLMLVVASLAVFVLYKNDWRFAGDIPAMIAKAFNRSSVTRLAGAAVDGEVSIGQVHRTIYENVFGRRLLIVGGSIEFVRKKPTSVVVKLVDENAKLIAEKEAVLGRVFTAADLNRISDARALEDAYGRLRANEWGEVPLAGDGAFMAVFMPVPDGVENRPVWNEIDVVMGPSGRGR